MKDNSFKLEYSPEFYNDFDAINMYIKNVLKNGIAAENLLDKIEKEIIDRLSNPIVYEQYVTRAGNIYYRIYVNNYMVFYTVSGNIMKVRRIYYNKRDFEKLI